MNMKSLFPLLVLVLVLVVSTHAAAKAKAGSAAIPRGKTKKGSAVGKIFGQGIIQKVFREAKISFCSELEALTLQLTRPNSNAVSMTSLDNIINFVNLEHDNPQLMVSLLVKFSRKLAEPNVYTKLKAMVVLHKLMEIVKEKARAGLLMSVQSLRVEMDEKFGAPFFSLDAIEDAAGLAGSVAEIEAVELARVYARYVFDFMDAKGSKSTAAATATSINITEEVQALLSLLEQSEEVEKCCKRANTKLNKQALESIKDDRTWILSELKELYKYVEAGNLRGEVEAVLKQSDRNFKPTAVSPKNLPAKTSPPKSATAAASTAAKPTQQQQPPTAKTLTRSNDSGEKTSAAPKPLQQTVAPSKTATTKAADLAAQTSTARTSTAKPSGAKTASDKSSKKSSKSGKKTKKASKNKNKKP